MQDYGLVSIITPSWNCEKFVGETIRSIQAQTYLNWELLFQDDCSNDDTERIVAAFAENDPRIKYQRNRENSGAAITRNNALKRAEGRWIAFLDSDDLWTSNKLELQLEFMTMSNYYFSYTNYCEIDEHSHETGVIISGPDRITKKKMFAFCWPGCLTVMYDRVHIGLIQIPDIKKNNDYAMWLKICRTAECHLLNEPLAKYRRGRAGSISTHGYMSLVKWHYRLFREVEKKCILNSIYHTFINLTCGIYKKFAYVQKYEISQQQRVSCN